MATDTWSQEGKPIPDSPPGPRNLADGSPVAVPGHMSEQIRLVRVQQSAHTTHVCACAYTHRCAQGWVWASVSAHACVYVHRCTHMQMYTNACVHVCMGVRFTCTQSHPCVHTHVYIAHGAQTRGQFHELALTLAGCWERGFRTWFRTTQMESWRVTGPASLSEGLGAPAHFHSADVESGTVPSS